jgi:hypothetical protein
MPIMKSKATGEEFDVPDSERNEALATGKFDEFYLMKSKADGEEFMVPAHELGDAMKSGKLELTEVYNQRKQIEANPTEATYAPISKTDSALTGLVGSATLGFDDEIYGGLAGLKEAATSDKSYIDAYHENRNKVRDMKRRAEQENPLSYMGGSLVGSAILPFGAGKAAGTLAGAVGKGALIGAGTGAIQGIGDNERSDEMVRDVAKGTALGGVLGGAAGGLGHLAKGVTKSGIAELGKELDAFHAGRDSITANGLLDEPRRIWAGIKETINSADSQEELFRILQGNKKVTVSRMIQDDTIDPSQEKAYLNFMDKLSDEEYILMKLQEGDPEISNWIAKQSGSNVADKQKFLAMPADERQALRSMDVKAEAKELAPIVENAKDQLWQDTTSRVAEHTNTARGAFDNKMTDFDSAMRVAAKDLENLGTLVSGKTSQRVHHASKLLANGNGGRADWDLKPDVLFKDASSDIKFNRLQKVRELIDEGIDWEKIRNKVRPPNQDEQVLMAFRDKVDGILKSTPGKAEADSVYKVATQLDDMLFGRTELKGGVDPYKIKNLLGNTDDANRFRDGLDKLREWSNSANPEAKAAADKFLDKFDKLLNKKKSSDALNQLSREGGPSALQIQRLDRSMKGDTSVTKHAVKQTADFLLDNESTNAFLQEAIGKPFKSMSAEEKTAFTKVYLKLKQQGGIGSPDAIRDNFKFELDKIKIK